MPAVASSTPPITPSVPPELIRRVHALRAGDRLTTSIVDYLVPVLVYQLTGSATWAGVAFAAEWIPRIVAIGLGGPLVDRLRPRVVLLAVTLARTILLTGGMAALAAGAGAPAIVVLGVACGFLAKVAYLATETLGAAVGRGHRDQARFQGVQTAIDQACAMVGPLVGGVLLVVGGQIGLGAALALSLITALLVAVVRMPPPAGAEGRDGRRSRGLRAGARALRAAPALCWLLAGLVTMNLLTGLLQAAVPVIVSSHGRSAAATGAVWSIGAAASLLAALLCARRLGRVGVPAIALSASLTAAAAGVGAALAGTYAQFVASMALLAAAEGAALVALRTTRARLIPQHVFGSTVAVMALVLLAPMPVGGLLLAAAPRAGLPALLIAVALLHTAVTVIAAFGLRRHRHSLTAVPLSPTP
ncbi:MFS transporter [Streptomyces calidiresistens]|uniref:Multidrug efflux pump Tap n=1 Tax=Streptomyces calidiresistens TaxID=1485586 RepID=A0A7W3T837_9ACTN|nr:MFS transporter [Streptomyces calidiresistens]